MPDLKSVRFTLAALFALLASAVAAGAQDGPPAHVRESVDAVLAMLGSEGDAALETFVDESMIESSVSDRAAFLDDLREMRQQASGVDDDLAVEGEPDGVRLIMSGGGREVQIKVVLDPAGISNLYLLSNKPEEAAQGEDAIIRGHIRAIEDAHRSELADLVTAFDENHFAQSYLAAHTLDQRRETLAALREAAEGAEDVSINVQGDRYVVSLIGSVRFEVGFQVEANAPYGMTSLDVVKVDDVRKLVFTADNLDEQFDALEADGMAGLVHIELGGEVAFQRAFGMANAELGLPNTAETVFATGSRPIDYTRAAIYLLDQQGVIDMDDSIDMHLDHVPADKKAITIRHLMTGQSGLPDFFDVEGDWDPDLQWVSRDEAERRLMAQTLLFEPGTDRKHSHGAFDLLAVMIEHVSGDSYYGFIRKNFLDPAGMTKTGEYGEARGLGVEDFAVGGGPSFVGVPNIPVNWGPTSWLVKGSGGMYSTLGDLQKFYALVRSDAVLDEDHNVAFRRPAANVDGSMRGFELFSAYNPAEGNEAYFFVNKHPGVGELFPIFDALGELVEPSAN